MSIFDKFSMKGKITVITGGAGGLGRHMAEALGQAGSDIVIAQRRIELAVEFARKLENSYNIRAIGVQCNVGDKDSVNNMVGTVLQNFRKINVLVNCAGISKWGDLATMPAEDWQSVINTNLNGTFYCSQAVGKAMIDKGNGSIINVASMSGLIVNSPQHTGNYCVSKAGVIHLTKCLAAEWAQYNVRVNAIAPGYIRTELNSKTIDAGGPKIERWLSLIPMNRVGSPEEIEGITLYLASGASTYTTGGVFVIDGGYTVW